MKPIITSPMLEKMKAREARRTVTPRTKTARTTRGGFACSELVDDWKRRVAMQEMAVKRLRGELWLKELNYRDARTLLAELKRGLKAAKSSTDQAQRRGEETV